MKKILFLPLFQMPSGHHHVADSLIDSIKSRSNQIECSKIDFLHYVNPGLEKLISSIYLKWISASPETYKKAYYQYSYTSNPNNLSLSFYEKLFLRRMEKLILKENPDLIICTHSFPSYLISRLKEKGKVRIPVINVYTDFFINSVWGTNGIDYHLVPDHTIKSTLVEKYGVPAKNIKVSGIPVHEKLETNLKDQTRTTESFNILIAGGSSGLGDMTGFIKEASKQKCDIKFTILCGKNRNLYDTIRSWNHPSIQCVPYLSSKEEMNRLYEQADAIVTKPGGVTISECMRKRVPIFVHSALPGQEDVNLNVLLAKQLVYKISKENSYIDQIIAMLKNEREMNAYKYRIDHYRSQLELLDSNRLSSFISAVLQQSELHITDESSIAKKHWTLFRNFKKKRSFAK